MAALRNFNPMSARELSDETRNAAKEAFDAMSTWRTQIVQNSESLIEKMAESARSLGWPQQIVDAARAQMQAITKTQIQTMDQIMDAWEEQIKSPNAPLATLSKLSSLPSLGPDGSWFSPDSLHMTASNPFGLYIQFIEQWQKAWTNAASPWIKAGKSFSS